MLRKGAGRIWELDFIRGLLILLMVVDHMFITVYSFYGPDWIIYSGGTVTGFTKFYDAAVFYCHHPARDIIQPAVAMIFIALCGISTGFSRNNAKRGAILGLVALAITTVTYAIGVDDAFVYFGIIHLLALCILVWAAINAITKGNRRKNLIVGAAISLAVWGLFLGATLNPAFKERLGNSFFLLIYTDSTSAMSPLDFFPLIPWSAMFFLAAALSPYIYPDRKTFMSALDGKWNRPVCFIGRHTIVVYALHVVIIVLILEILSYYFVTDHAWLFFG